MKQGAVGLLWAVLVLTTTWTARAEESSSAARNAAGWVVLGVGGSIGLGSVATGGVLMAIAKQNDEQRVGGATLAGGGATVLASVLIGLPLILSSGGSNDKKRNEAVLDAVSGRFRW